MNKMEKTVKIKQAKNKLSQKVLCSHYAKTIFNAQQAQFQITQTCKTIRFKQNKMICAKKIQSKVITIQSTDLPKFKKNLEKFNIAGISGTNLASIEKISKIPGLSDFVTFQSSSQQQQTLFSQIIGEAVQAICDIIDNWIYQWQDQLQNSKLLIQTVKIIQSQFQIAKKELKRIIQSRKVKLKQLSQKKSNKQVKRNSVQNQTSQNDSKINFDADIQIRQLQAAELIDALFNQLPQLSDYFDYFDSSMFSTAQLTELKDLNSEILNQIMQIDFSKAKDKKKKKKTKNKKKKGVNIIQNNNDNKLNQLNVLTTENLICSQVLQTNSDQADQNQNEEITQICQFIDKIEINFENRGQCRVTEEWLLNLQREMRYSKILLQS